MAMQYVVSDCLITGDKCYITCSAPFFDEDAADVHASDLAQRFIEMHVGQDMYPEGIPTYIVVVEPLMDSLFG